MRSILVVNPKGGSGKTTIATNLAGYYSVKGLATTLVDLDQQKSAFQWANSRPDSATNIEIFSQLQESYSGERIIYDCPAQIDITLTAKLINQSDVIIMPINPSVIDHRAAFKFIFDVRRLIRTGKCPKIDIGLVANRANSSFNSYGELREFAKMMRTPIVAALRNSQNYVSAAEVGLTLFDIPNQRFDHDRAQWRTLISWAEGTLFNQQN